MTNEELIQLLQTHDEDKQVIALGTVNDEPLKITGIDSYEDALVLVTEPA